MKYLHWFMVNPCGKCVSPLLTDEQKPLKQYIYPKEKLAWNNFKRGKVLIQVNLTCQYWENILEDVLLIKCWAKKIIDAYLNSYRCLHKVMCMHDTSDRSLSLYISCCFLAISRFLRDTNIHCCLSSWIFNPKHETKEFPLYRKNSNHQYANTFINNKFPL